MKLYLYKNRKRFCFIASPMNKIVNNLGIILKLPMIKHDFTSVKQIKKMISSGDRGELMLFFGRKIQITLTFYCRKTALFLLIYSIRSYFLLYSIYRYKISSNTKRRRRHRFTIIEPCYRNKFPPLILFGRMITPANNTGNNFHPLKGCSCHK